MSCTGNGRCMKVCCCKNICSCLDIAHEHIELDKVIFCKVICKHECEPIQCLNKQCKRVFKSVKEQTKCNDCNIFQIEFIEVKEECCICYQTKYMIETQCKHRYCYDCLMDDQSEVIRCHICRTELLFNEY